MHRLAVALWGMMLLVLLTGGTGFAEVPERRKDQFGREFSYYVYPIAGEIPGIGKAAGFGASVLNMAGSDTDFTGYYVRGDFMATGAAVLDYQLIPHRLVLDAGYNDFMVVPVSYSRGINSDPNDVIHPRVEGSYLLGQMTLTFDERRYEAFVRMLRGQNRLTEVLDKDGKAFPGVDTAWRTIDSISLGGSLDLTDDRLDPRKGVRFEIANRLPHRENPDAAAFVVTDYNLTGYVPMRKWDTLALNLFHSRAYVTSKGVTDYAQLQARHGLNCTQYAPGPDRDACVSTETKLLDNMLAANRYGTATGLGGTQRLRAFDDWRFYAGQSLFYGAEYRWNLTDEYTPFNIYVAKGVRTGIQLAAFWERGMVAERFGDLFRNGRDCYGVGARLVLSGVIIRFDLAQSKEGTQTQIFITYPWSTFSVDNPG